MGWSVAVFLLGVLLNNYIFRKEGHRIGAKAAGLPDIG
jgi:hypothetical protein